MIGSYHNHEFAFSAGKRQLRMIQAWDAKTHRRIPAAISHPDI
jgi:hypothetical protein